VPKPDTYPEEVTVDKQYSSGEVPVRLNRDELKTMSKVDGFCAMCLQPGVNNRYEVLAVSSRLLHDMEELQKFDIVTTRSLQYLRDYDKKYGGLKESMTDKEYQYAVEVVANRIAHLLYLAVEASSPGRRKHVEEAKQLCFEAEKWDMFIHSARMYQIRAQIAVMEYELSSKHTDRQLKKAEKDFKYALEQCQETGILKQHPWIRREILSLSYNGLGTIYYSQRKFSEALDIFESCVFVTHQYTCHTLWFIALCYKATGDAAKASQAVAEVLKRDPDHPEALSAKLMWTKDQQQKSSVLGKVYQHHSAHPVCAQAFAGLSLQALDNAQDLSTEAKLKNFEDIEKRLMHSVQIAKSELDKAESFYLIGQLHQKRGDYGEAAGWYEKTEAIRGDHLRALAGLYYCKKRLGSPVIARSYLLKLRDMVPHDVQVMRALVHSHVECRAWREALQACQGYLVYAKEQSRSSSSSSSAVLENQKAAEADVKQLRAQVYTQMREDHDRRSALEEYEKILKDHYPMPEKAELEEKKKQGQEGRDKKIAKLRADVEKVWADYNAQHPGGSTSAKTKAQISVDKLERKIRQEQDTKKAVAASKYSYWDYVFDLPKLPQLPADEQFLRTEFKVWNDVATLQFLFNHHRHAAAAMKLAVARSKVSAGACSKEDEACMAFNQAMLAEKDGEFAEAKKFLTQCLQRKPGYADAEDSLNRLKMQELACAIGQHVGGGTMPGAFSAQELATQHAECKKLLRKAEKADHGSAGGNPDDPGNFQGVWLLLTEALSSGEPLAAIERLETQIKSYDSDDWVRGRGHFSQFEKSDDAVLRRKKHRGDLYVHLGNLYLEQADNVWRFEPGEGPDDANLRKSEAVELLANAEVAYQRALDDYASDWPECAATAKNGLGMLHGSPICALFSASDLVKGGDQSMGVANGFHPAQLSKADKDAANHMRTSVLHFQDAMRMYRADTDAETQTLIRVNLAHTMMRRDNTVAAAKFALRKYLLALKSPNWENNVSLLNATALAYARDGDLDNAIELLRKAYKLTAGANSAKEPLKSDMVTTYNLALMLDAKQQHILQTCMREDGGDMDTGTWKEVVQVKEESIRMFNKVKEIWSFIKTSEEQVAAHAWVTWGIEKTTKRDRQKMMNVTSKRAKALKSEFRQIKQDYEKRAERDMLERGRIEQALADEKKKMEADKKKLDEQKEAERTAQELREKAAATEADATFERGLDKMQLDKSAYADDTDDKKKEQDRNLSALVDDTEMEPQVGFGRGRRPGVPLTEEQKAARQEAKRLKALERENANRDALRAGAAAKREKSKRERPKETAEEKASRQKAKAERRAKKNRGGKGMREQADALELHEDFDAEFDEVAQIDVTEGAGNVEDEKTNMNVDANDVDAFLKQQGIAAPADDDEDEGKKKKKKKDKKNKRDREDGGSDEEGGKKKKKKQKKEKEGGGAPDDAMWG